MVESAPPPDSDSALTLAETGGGPPCPSVGGAFESTVGGRSTGEPGPRNWPVKSPWATPVASVTAGLVRSAGGSGAPRRSRLTTVSTASRP